MHPAGALLGFQSWVLLGGCAGPGTKERRNELSPGILPPSPKSCEGPDWGFKSRGFKISRAPLALRSQGSPCHLLSPGLGGATSGGARVWHGRSPSPSPQHPLESGSRSGAAPAGAKGDVVAPRAPRPTSSEGSVTQKLWPRRGPGFAPQSQGRRLASSSGAAEKAENSWSLGLLPFLLLLLFSLSLLFPFLLISWGFSFVSFFFSSS